MAILTAALAGAAIGGGGSILGKHAKDKRKLTREKDSTRKLSEGLLLSEAIRGLSGRENDTDRLEASRLRGEAYNDIGNKNSALLRNAGMAGITSPGILENINSNNEAGITGLIGARSAGRINRRNNATGVLTKLMAANPPYVKERVKEGHTWAKALSGALQGGAMGAGGAKGKPTNTLSPETKKLEGEVDSLPPLRSWGMTGGRSMRNAPGRSWNSFPSLPINQKLSGLQALYGGTPNA